MSTVPELIAELAALENPKARAINERHGDDHGVGLSAIRAIAKRLKTQHELAIELWATDDTAAQLLALLVCKPKEFSADQLDSMLREARAPKVIDWLVNYVVKKSPHSEALRLRWTADTNPTVAAAGWALTTERVAKRADGLDLAGLLDTITDGLRAIAEHGGMERSRDRRRTPPHSRQSSPADRCVTPCPTRWPPQ